MLLFSPAVSLIAVTLIVRSSAKAQSMEESQQGAVFLILPLILLVMGQFMGVLLISFWILLGLSIVCCIVAGLLLEKIVWVTFTMKFSEKVAVSSLFCYNEPDNFRRKGRMQRCRIQQNPALEASLKHLMLLKPLDKITISDLTTDCGISRMAFYYHFKDIYDLVEWSCLEDARKALQGKKDV